MTPRRAWAGAGLVGLTVLLGGCLSSGEDDLREWMAQQRRQTPPKVKPIPPPKVFQPADYARDGAGDPFSRDKLTQALRQAADKRMESVLLAPELKRPRGVLEAFPLDAVTMIGSLVKDGRAVALVKVDNLLYQVRQGDYLGQNYGRVMRVSETEVVLREIVQDAIGEWVERTATLQLQEGKK